MIKHWFSRSSALQILLLAAAVFMLAGCEKDDVNIDPDFSINVCQPGPKWPNPKNLTPAQKEVLDKYGKPDFFHVWWTPDGQYRTRTDFVKEQREGKKRPIPPYSYVYLRLNKDICFRGSDYQVLPVSDQLRVVCQLGDPEDIRTMESGVLQWMYYSAGKLYKFGRGRIVEEKDFPAMGKFGKM